TAGPLPGGTPPTDLRLPDKAPKNLARSEERNTKQSKQRPDTASCTGGATTGVRQGSNIRSLVSSSGRHRRRRFIRRGRSILAVRRAGVGRRRAGRTTRLDLRPGCGLARLRPLQRGRRLVGGGDVLAVARPLVRGGRARRVVRLGVGAGRGLGGHGRARLGSLRGGGGEVLAARRPVMRGASGGGM